MILETFATIIFHQIAFRSVYIAEAIGQVTKDSDTILNLFGNPP